MWPDMLKWTWKGSVIKKIMRLQKLGRNIFLICFPGFTVRIHLLMFGTYRINERKDSNPALHLQFAKES